MRWHKKLIALPIASQFNLMPAEDGSGKGAGLVGAIAQRINARNELQNNGKMMNDKEMKLSGHHNGITNGFTNGRS